MALGPPLIEMEESWIPRSAKPEAVGPAFDLTLGVSRVNARALRPFSGSSATRRCSTTLPSDVLLVSTSGASPLTSTVSATCPRSIRMFTCAR
jgi:hypothetical protein